MKYFFCEPCSKPSRSPCFSEWMFVLQILLSGYSMGLHIHHGKTSGIFLVIFLKAFFRKICPGIPPDIIIKIFVMFLSEIRFEKFQMISLFKICYRKSFISQTICWNSNKISWKVYFSSTNILAITISASLLKKYFFCKDTCEKSSRVENIRVENFLRIKTRAHVMLFSITLCHFKTIPSGNTPPPHRLSQELFQSIYIN